MKALVYDGPGSIGWQDGIIPDVDWALGPPTQFPLSLLDTRALLARVELTPRLTWGSDPFGIGDMWNSNSLVSWLLETSGINAAELTPPADGSAPGWRSGIAAATLGDSRG